MRKAGVVFAILLCGLGRPVQAQSAEVRFQQALRLERVSGNFQGAIDVYRSIAHDEAVSREDRASAWMKMGAAYEQLGTSGAVEAYRTVAGDFGDLPVAVEARRRLDRLVPAEPESSPPSGPARLGLRPEWQDWGIEGGDLSADGQRFAGIDPERLTLWIEDLGDGKRIAILGDFDRDGSSGAPRSPRFSPDGSELAFSFLLPDGVEEIRVWDSERLRSVLDVSARFGAGPGEARSDVLDWAGDSLLVSMSTLRRLGTSRVAVHQLALVDVASGASRVVLESDEDTAPWRRACLAGPDRIALYRDSPTPMVTVISAQGESLHAFPEPSRLFGCLRDRGEVVWSTTLLANTSVTATRITGSVKEGRLLSVVTGSIAPQFLTQSGLAVYTRGPFDGFRVVEIGLDHDTHTGMVRPLEPWGTEERNTQIGAWSVDGKLLMQGLRGTRLAIREGSGAFRYYDLPIRARERGRRARWFLDGTRVHTSYFGTFTDSGLDETMVLNPESGEAQRYPGVLAWEPLPDAFGVFQVEWDTPKGTCIHRTEFESMADLELWCAGVRIWNINLATAPTGEWLAVTHQHEQSGWTIRVMRPDGSDNRVLWESPARPYGPSRLYWSGDGAAVYFTSGYPESRVWKLDVDTGEAKEILSELQGVLEMYGFSPSPDGTRAIARARYRRLSEEEGPFVLRLPVQD